MKKETCKLCFKNNFIESGPDIVCKNCGAVLKSAEPVEHNATKYSIPLNAETKLGSSNLVDAELKLSHLNKRYTTRMLDRSDVYLEYFSRACDDLHVPKNVARNAFYMFRKMRLVKKKGLGKIAVFCIYYSYIMADVTCDTDHVIEVIRYRFGLRRNIIFSKVLYRIKPVAIEMGLADVTTESVALYFRKNIDPEYHHLAMEIMDAFAGNINQKTKAIQKYLEAYGPMSSTTVRDTNKNKRSDKIC